MKAIFKKEFKSYFLSPIGYIFVGVFIILSAVFFLNGSLLYGAADIDILFSNINVICVFLVSILTMRLLSEERNKKTDQLLLCAPVSVTEIVVGKYLAAMAVFGVTMVITFVYPAVLCIFGEPSMSEIIGSYIGFILLWGAFISIGVLVSALTESQVIAAVFTFGILLIIYLLDGIASSVSNPVVLTVIQWLSLLRRFGEFQNGILNITNIVYYFSFIFVMLLLAVRAIEKRRYA